MPRMTFVIATSNRWGLGPRAVASAFAVHNPGVPHKAGIRVRSPYFIAMLPQPATATMGAEPREARL